MLGDEYGDLQPLEALDLRMLQSARGGIMSVSSQAA